MIEDEVNERRDTEAGFTPFNLDFFMHSLPYNHNDVKRFLAHRNIKITEFINQKEAKK